MLWPALSNSIYFTARFGPKQKDVAWSAADSSSRTDLLSLRSIHAISPSNPIMKQLNTQAKFDWPPSSTYTIPVDIVSCAEICHSTDVTL